jgi:hypothetical protein
MRIDRQQFLDDLCLAQLGTSSKGLMEQVDCLILDGSKVVSYNGEVKVEVTGHDLAGVRGAIPPGDLINLLRKLPDNEIEVGLEEGGQLAIMGKNRKASISFETGVRLDLSDIKKPGKWVPLPEVAITQLRRAADTCGVDDTWGAATCIHVTRNLVEASDNFRLFRWEGKTGFDEEVFIPAQSISILESFTPDSVSVSGGWCHFWGGRVVVSIRGRQLERYPDLAKASTFEGDLVEFPAALSEIGHRAGVVAEGEGHSIRISVDIKDGKGRVKSKSVRGWYREVFKMGYTGSGLSFDVHPRILSEIVNFSSKVVVGADRISAKVGEALFVIALKSRESE